MYISSIPLLRLQPVDRTGSAENPFDLLYTQCMAKRKDMLSGGNLGNEHCVEDGT
jgi:hypothetical protein